MLDGKVFIDATTEGDLMAASGVSTTFGREPNAKYGETKNGVLKIRIMPSLRCRWTLIKFRAIRKAGLLLPCKVIHWEHRAVVMKTYRHFVSECALHVIKPGKYRFQCRQDTGAAITKFISVT